MEGTRVIVEPEPGTNGAVMSPDFQPLGELKAAIRGPRHDVVSAQVGAKSETVDLEYFGPGAVK